MKNIHEWKELLEEVVGKNDKTYVDQVSVCVPYNSGFLIIETSENGNGLQIQFRRSTDPEDAVATQNIIAHGKIVSALTPTNHNEVKKTLLDFIGLLN